MARFLTRLLARFLARLSGSDDAVHSSTGTTENKQTKHRKQHKQTKHRKQTNRTQTNKTLKANKQNTESNTESESRTYQVSCVNLWPCNCEKKQKTTLTANYFSYPTYVKVMYCLTSLNSVFFSGRRILEFLFANSVFTLKVTSHGGGLFLPPFLEGHFRTKFLGF